MTGILAAQLVLLVLVVVTALAATQVRNLIAASMLMGIYSLLMACVWVDLQAPDVAFTEAAVGAGVSTVFLLAALARTNWEEKPGPRFHLGGLVLCGVLAGALAYGSADLPPVGSADSPPQELGNWYLDHTSELTRVPNVVTAVLASFRSYDTMFETAVIFCAGAGVLLLLWAPRRREPEKGGTT